MCRTADYPPFEATSGQLVAGKERPLSARVPAPAAASEHGRRRPGPRQGSPEWLEARRSTIGSSDIPVIVGESSFKDARTLAAEKLGLVESAVDPESAQRMAIGHILQPALLGIYEVITDRRARAERGMRRHPQIEWATASLDGTAPIRRIVEAKWSNAARWRSGERVPGDVNAQVQWQMFIVGWDVADVVALDHGVPRVEVVERDDRMIDDLLWFADEFHGYLERGELPPPDGSETARRTLTRMYPADDGTWVEPTADLRLMVDQLRSAKAEKAEAEKLEGSIANALRAILGDASGVTGLVSYRKSADATRTNWPAVAGAYRELLHDIPSEELDALVSIHSETVQGPRVLRLLKGATE